MFKLNYFTLFDCSPEGGSSPLLSFFPLNFASRQSDGVLVNSLPLAKFHRNPLNNLKNGSHDKIEKRAKYRPPDTHQT